MGAVRRSVSLGNFQRRECVILWQIQRDGVDEKVWKSREMERFGRKVGKMENQANVCLSIIFYKLANCSLKQSP